METQQTFGSTAGHIAFPGAHVETGGTLNVTVSNSRPPPTVARPHFVVPFKQNKEVIDRPDIFVKLDDLLPPVDEYQCAALWGLGGSGKTQIALEFAYRRFYDNKCPVYWVHADNEATFTQGYEVLARLAGVTDKQGQELLVAVREWIEAQESWLLVVDNADDLSIFGVGSNMSITRKSSGEACLNDYIPQAPYGTVLWTSRDKRIVDIVGSRQAIEVSRMTVKEATALFEASSNENIAVEDKLTVSELLIQLDHLPLAVSQAAAYIRRTSTPVSEYLSRLREGKKRWRLLQRSEHDRHRRREVPNSILETWTISMEHLKRENGAAYRILLVLAYVHNQNIPESLIRAAALEDCRDDTNDTDDTDDTDDADDADDADEDDDSEISTDDSSYAESETDSDDNNDAFTDALTRLREFSFLSPQKQGSELAEKTYKMHKLVQDAARYSMNQKGRLHEAARYAKEALNLVLFLFPPSQPGKWEKTELWLPHALQVSDWAELCKAGTDSETVNLLSQVSGFLLDRGRWREKETVDTKAYALSKRAQGDGHPVTLETMHNLGITYSSQGRYSEAEKIIREVLKLRQEILSERHPDTLASMASLAATYHSQGRYSEAEEIKREALTLYQEVLGERHPDTLASIASLAATYHSQGRYSEAEEIRREVLKLYQEVLGERHPGTINNIASLAVVYHSQGRYNEAGEIKREALKLYQEVLGEKHPETLACIADLAATYHSQERYSEAEEIKREALKLYQEVLGERHPETLASIASLAATYYSQGRYSEAEVLEREALKLRQEVLGERHLDTITSMTGLAVIYHSQGRYSEAEVLEREALKLRQEVLGERHLDTITSMTGLAVIYHSQGRYSEAEVLEREALKLRQEVLGERHLDNITSMTGLAVIYHSQGRYSEAEEILREAIELRQE
ncbi:kinesin light chain [Colletotrichum truncatum]|uniref:Kinesin light chain n=1 Tax=Colletotrichum truncatum TaxID=5467 RepID=A0ACC3Z6N0_COLTU|nr:kinesin light chain [Colletotrichum truncatum]KAF6788002.1 kinesin light chain [Colletotrichum truncatum]